MAKAATLRSAPAIDVAILRSGRVLQRSKTRFDSPMAGLAAICGPSGNDDCCTSLLVPGGTFDRSYDGVDFTDPNYPAMVDDFYLDKYEITVGRFRVFVNAGMGTQAKPPAAGDGAHPLITGSGWDSTWRTNLPADTAGLKSAISSCGSYSTWTDPAGSNESKPVNCLTWYTAFAFCAWDGGRLATEAEWNYAAAGGSEQRYYPWSSPATSTTIGDSYAVYDLSGTCTPLNVGSKSPKGDGKWGQSDLAGNVFEWMLDWYESPYSMPCNNCADLTTASNRVFRGGGCSNPPSILRSAFRENGAPRAYLGIGSRCARASSYGGSGAGGNSGYGGSLSMGGNASRGGVSGADGTFLSGGTSGAGGTTGGGGTSSGGGSSNGITWTTQGPLDRWGAVASSADGTKLFAGGLSPTLSGTGYLYRSTDSGATWTQGEFDQNGWDAIAHTISPSLSEWIRILASLKS